MSAVICLCSYIQLGCLGEDCSIMRMGDLHSGLSSAVMIVNRE